MIILKKYGLKLIVWIIFISSLVMLIYRFSTINQGFNFSLIINNISNIWILFLVILLMLLNWSIEALKWQISTKYIEALNYYTSLKGTLLGVSVSLLFPNRTGEFLGKIVVLNKQNRIKGIFASMLSSLSQLLITLLLGIVGLYFYPASSSLIQKYHYLMSYTLLFTTLVVYFFLPLIIKKYPFLFPKKFLVFIDFFGLFKFREIMQLISFSFLRYSIFLFQMYLLFILFSSQLPIINFVFLASVSFLLTTIIPTTSFTELFVRNQVGLIIFSHSILPDEIIVSVFTLLWIINIAIPAFAGLLIGLKIKL